MTKVTRTGVTLALSALLCLAAALPARASEDLLARAKDLYRAAAYDEALVVLDRLAADQSGGTIEVSEYRVFCLLALDRRDEARDAIQAMVIADPLYQVSDMKASPRMRAVFNEVRRPLLAGIARQMYADAKSAFDRSDAAAAGQFERLVTLLGDPDIASNPAFEDLRVVATGFRDLSKATSAKPAAQASIPLAVASSAPAERAERAPAGAPPNATPAAATTASTSVVYRDGEPGLTPPVAVAQILPRWTPPGQLGPRREWSGQLEIVIDEEGDVASATLRSSIHPGYDAQLLRAAQSWKFRPALKGGTPARYAKTITILLDARPSCGEDVSSNCRP